MDLKRILCIRTLRILRSNNTVWHDKKIFLVEDRLKIKPREILVEERLDGRFYLMDKDESLSYREVEEAPLKLPKPKKPRPVNTPSKDHPYRRWNLKGHGMTYGIKTVKDVEELMYQT